MLAVVVINWKTHTHMLCGIIHEVCTTTMQIIFFIHKLSDSTLKQLTLELSSNCILIAKKSRISQPEKKTITSKNMISLSCRHKHNEHTMNYVFCPERYTMMMINSVKMFTRRRHVSLMLCYNLLSEMRCVIEKNKNGNTWCSKNLGQLFNGIFGKQCSVCCYQRLNNLTHFAFLKVIQF